MLPRPFYQQQWFKFGVPLAFALIVYAVLQYMFPQTLAGWLVDTIALLMMYVGLLALASQYILPVRTLRERREAYQRMMSYVTGGHGPILFVRDGLLIGDPVELLRRGAGVILVDGSSAVVLEKGRKFSRAEGPGLVFTQYGERLAAAFDLRKQSRAHETAALTKDGIEVKTSVSVTFALDPGEQVSVQESPDERDFFSTTRITPEFPFNPESAFRAYYGFAVTEKQEVLKWTDLPVVVATEYFRDQVSRLTLDDLFMPAEPLSSPVSALQTRLTDQVQKAQLLRDRGIKVYSVSISTLDLPDEVMRLRVRSWAAHWQKEAIAALSNAEVEAERIKEKARAEAQAEMLGHLREYLSQTFTGDGEQSKREIAQKFVTALNRVASDPVTRMLISGDTMRQLANLRYWVGIPGEAEAPPAQVIGKPASEDLSEIVAADGPGLEDSQVMNAEEPDGSDSGQDDDSAQEGA